MLDVFPDVLTLENDTGRAFASFHLIGTGFDFPPALSSRGLGGDEGADADDAAS
jgi:hypothetical protein